MLDVRDISAGNFQGNIFFVYEDKPTNKNSRSSKNLKKYLKEKWSDILQNY